MFCEIFYEGNNFVNKICEIFYEGNNFVNKICEIFYEGNNFVNKVCEIFYEGNNFVNKVCEIFYIVLLIQIIPELLIHIILSTNQNLTMRGLNKVTLIGNLDKDQYKECPTSI